MPPKELLKATAPVFQDLEKKDRNPEKSDDEAEKKAENEEEEVEEEEFEEEDIEEVDHNRLLGKVPD